MGRIKSYAREKIRNLPVVREALGVPDADRLLEQLERQTTAITTLENMWNVINQPLEEVAAIGQSQTIATLSRQLPGRGLGQDMQLFMYHLIREALPIVQSGLANRRYLEGKLIVESEDEGLRRALTEWASEVAFGEEVEGFTISKGLSNAINASADNADTYGLGVIEPILDDAGRQIERLHLPKTRTLYLKRDPAQGGLLGPYRMYQRTKEGARDRRRRRIRPPVLVPVQHRRGMADAAVVGAAVHGRSADSDDYEHQQHLVARWRPV